MSQTRVTTKYNIPNLDSPKYQKPEKRRRDGEAADAAAAPKVPKAFLTLKTYDPESGVVLKFKTDRAAEVGRLITGLGGLGRHMAALPEKTEGMEIHTRRASKHLLTVTPTDTVMEDVPPAEEAAAPVNTQIAAPSMDTKPQQAQSGGGGGKKKKKGKK